MKAPRWFWLLAAAAPAGRCEGGLVVLRTGTSTAIIEPALADNQDLNPLQVDGSPGQPRAWILMETWGADPKAAQPVVKARR